MADVARLLMSSLTIDQRRLVEDEFVRSYGDRLAESGVPDYDFLQAKADYAVGLIHNVMVYIVAMPIVDLSAMRPREEASGVSLLGATFGRLESALEDHDTLAVVKQRLSLW